MNTESNNTILSLAKALAEYGRRIVKFEDLDGTVMLTIISQKRRKRL